MTSTLDQIASHMQFLGYEIVQRDEVKIARHPKKWNVMMRVNKGGILFTSINSVQDAAKSNKAGYLGFINTLNSKASVVRFYADAESDFFMEAWYPDFYDKAKFGAFLDAWESETSTLLFAQGEETLKYLK